MPDTSKPISNFDASLYEHLLDDPALCPKQKAECLKTLRGILTFIIDYAWSQSRAINPPESCGKLSESVSEQPFARRAVLCSEHKILTNHYRRCAMADAAEREE